METAEIPFDDGVGKERALSIGREREDARKVRGATTECEWGSAAGTAPKGTAETAPKDCRGSAVGTLEVVQTGTHGQGHALLH